MSKFARAVKRFGGRKAVAMALGCTYEFIRQLEGPDAHPSLPMSFKIQELLNVPVSYWKERAAANSDGKTAA